MRWAWSFFKLQTEFSACKETEGKKKSYQKFTVSFNMFL